MPQTMNSNSAPAIAQALNKLLADSYALFLKTKNFHWHVEGPHFRDYHLLFEEQADQILASTDEIAERVRKIGQPTLRSIGDIVRHQTIKDNDTAGMNADEMIAELSEDNRQIIRDMREVKKLADEAGDNATSGLIDTFTDEAEQRTWFLTAAGGRTVKPV